MSKEMTLYTCESGIKLCASGAAFDAWLLKGEGDFEVKITTTEIIDKSEVDGETIYKIKSN